MNEIPLTSPNPYIQMIRLGLKTTILVAALAVAYSHILVLVIYCPK